MDITREQIKLLMRRRGERSDNTLLWPTRDNIGYLRRFFQSHKRLGLAALIFLFFQGCLEISLIVISHRYLKGTGKLYATLSDRNLLAVLLALSVVYLVVYFLAIKSERTFIIRLINDLRLKWFKLSLHQPAGENNLEEKGVLLAKISYHLPLLSTGLTNSVIGAIQWLLLMIILAFLCLIFGYKFLWLLLPVLLISVIIAAAAFFVSRNYVSRETTFYSKIIRLVDFSLSDHHFTKLFGRERTILKEFNYLVDLDSYFRVRRELWMRFGGGVVFVLLIFLSWTLGLFTKQINTFFAVSATDTKFALIIFIIYFSRLLYESLRIGLYMVPFFLGLALSVPLENAKKLGREDRPNFKELAFKSMKVKFFKKDIYHKKLNFQFALGGRYLVTAPHRVGKTALAQFFTGNGRYGRRAWIIKADGRRFFYNDFFENYSGFYFIDPYFTSQRTLLEVVTGKEKQFLSNDDFIRITDRVNAHAELRDIFFEKDDWRLNSSKFLTNAKNVLLLQVLYCLEKKPYLVALDNHWLDYRDPAIDALLDLLAQELPQSILVFFATDRRGDRPYDRIYEI